MNEAALRLCSVTKRYGRHEALREVSLNVRPGDLYGFLGHNGAGKTTALRIALGLIRSDAGRVLVQGFDASCFPREARARQGGLIETPGFYPWMSGRRNLVLLAGLSGLSRRVAGREADRLLEAVGLSSVGYRRVGGYSQGMRQRLGIAQALLGDPSLILLDEPMNGLDPEGIEELRRLLVRLVREDGRTVVLSSHQLHEIAGVCNRVGILREGRLLVEAETATLLAADGRRLVLRTSDDRAAASVLAEGGIETVADAEGGLTFDAGETSPDDLSRLLVERGLGIRELAPRSVSLEEIYLRYSRGEMTDTAASEDAPIVVGKPAETRAPRRPVVRAMVAEGRRLLSHLAPPVALILPAGLAALSVARQWARARGHLAEVETGDLYSHTLVTAFEGAAVALQTAMPLAAVIVAGLASQSLAGDLSRGTLRNLLLRPVGRVPLGLGKASGILLAALLCFALTAVVSVVGASQVFEFTDVVEILEIETAEPWVHTEAADLWPLFHRMFPLLALSILAYAAFGFLAGALCRGNATALALAVGGVVVLELLRVPGREFGFEHWLLSAHSPSPLSDTSVVSRLLDEIHAPNDVFPESAGGDPLVPLAWLAGSVALSVLILRRRSVP